MTRQPSLLTPSLQLPQAFVDAWDALERRRGVRPVIEPVVVEQRYGRWTIVLRVDGKTHPVVHRPDLEGAARDLFTQVYGPIAQDEQ